MTYRVKVYDTNNKLICWYTEPSDKRVQSYVRGLPPSCTYTINRIVG